MSVVAARMWCMAEGRSLRRIGDPVVAPAPAGVRLRTRIRPTAEEAEALTAMGELLGSVYRGELVERIRLGRLHRTTHARWRAERKQAVTAVSSSRWAGAITRAVEDQYQLGMRGVAAQVADLRAAVEVLAQRCVLRPGQLAPAEGTEPHGRSRRRRRGYRSAAERFTKTGRLAVLRDRLATAEDVLTAGRPSITVGGKRLWRNRNHLAASDMDEQLWRDRWDAARMFLTADGESGKSGGNETIRVDEHGRLRVKVPSALVEELGAHLQIAVPVQFTHRDGEWLARVAARRAVRYDISYDPDRGRWYLDASWKTSPEPVSSFDELRTGRVLGVDLNHGHLAACVLDAFGNPIGEPVTIEVVTAGLRALSQGFAPVLSTPAAGVGRVHPDHGDPAAAGHTGQPGPEPGGGNTGYRAAQSLSAVTAAEGFPAGGARVGEVEVLDHQRRAVVLLQFRPTDTPTTRHAGPPENTHRQRPTPFGPHRLTNN
jgi:hypothetical protein